MFIVLTSQFEWNEQVESETETIRPLILAGGWNSNSVELLCIWDLRKDLAS
ncbi:unnamed protein product [Arabidopsis lyrata]|nr:unnamed protein product [Arabidopsis lyrata]